MSFAVISFGDKDDVEGRFFDTEEDALAFYKSKGLSQTCLLLNSLGQELKSWRSRADSTAQMRQWWEENLAAHLDLELTVSNMAGTSWNLRADRKWTVRDLKTKLAPLSEVPAQQQRLIYLTSVVSDAAKLGDFGEQGAHDLQLTLMRRQPLQSQWLEKVKADASALEGAPPEIRADAEIVMAAAEQDANLQLLAAPQLLADPQYVFTAIKQRGGPEASDLATSALSWVQLAADAKLALRAASHLESREMGEQVMKLPAWRSAPEECRVHLVAEPYATASATRECLAGLPKELVRKALQRSTLDNVAVGIACLDMEREAAESGIGRAITSFFASKLKVPVLESEVMAPGTYAMELFMHNSGHFRSADGGTKLERLLLYLGRTQPTPAQCCTLVQACLQHAKNEQAEKFFRAGADDSDECLALLTEARLPMTVLQRGSFGPSPARERLLAKVLASYGGPIEFLDAVRQNRNMLQTLIRGSTDDASIGRSEQVYEALQLAVQQGDEAIGSHLLKAFAAPSPQKLPDFEVPVAWLDSLRAVSSLQQIVAAKVFEILQAAGDDQLGGLIRTCWAIIDWNAATSEQLSRALDVVNRLGMHFRLGLAEMTGREGVRQRLEAEAQLAQVFTALPLARLEDTAALCRPGMPEQALSRVAFERARLAEEQARRAEAANTQLRQALENDRAEVSRKHQNLQSQISSLETKVRDLQRDLRRERGQG